MSEASQASARALQALLASILQWEVSVPICCLAPQTRHHQTCCHVPLLYFSLFTKAQQGDVCGAGEGACKELLPTEVEKEEKGWGHEVAPQGRVLGPLEGKDWFCSPIPPVLF